MQTFGWRLGPLESKLLAWVQLRKVERFQREEAAKALRMSLVQATQLLSRMSRRGLIVQLKQGLYLAPVTLPPGGKWMPPPAIVIQHLMEEMESDWQITGPVAFHYYGLTEQVPNVTMVYNTQLTGMRHLGSLAIQFIKVPAARIGGVGEPIDPARGRMPTLARALVDAVCDYPRFGSLPAAYQWLMERKNQTDLLLDVATEAKAFGNVGTRRRIGYYLQKLGSPKRVTEILRESLHSTQSVIPLLPGTSRRGISNPEWGIIDNLSLPTDA